jgi:ADP-ribosylglycohydrolase
MTNRVFVTAASVLVGLSGCARITSAAPLSQEQWAQRVHAGWVGKVAAGSGALPTEMWSREAIRAKYGELAAPPEVPTSRGPLDDTTLAFLGWQAAREHGVAFTSQDIAREWVDHLADADLKGGGFGKEFLEVLRRLRQSEQPPIRTGSPRAEWIAAQMRAEIWGMLAPGDPVRAADYAARDASIFNTGNGIYAAQFVAVLASRLMVDPDIRQAVDAARALVPSDSVLARAIDDTLAWHAQAPGDWGAGHDRFVDKYRDRSLEQRFAAWSSGWLVETGGWPDADILPEYQGRPNVLRTHPFSDTEPARLTSEVRVPAAGGTLKVCANCNDTPPTVDWVLRVGLGETTTEQPIRWTDGRPQWQEFSFDLAPWAGQTMTIVLENAVLGKFAWEAGFWTVPQLLDSDGRPLEARRPANGVCRYPVSFAPAILPETFSVLIGLLYGDGDFRRSVSLTTMCGFDTDCNAGTVGCLLGLRNGLDAIPTEWRDPLNDTYDLQVTGLPRTWLIADLAAQMAETGVTLAQGQ